LIAILRGEPEADRFVDALLSGAPARISAGTLLEAQMVAERDCGLMELERLIALAAIKIVPVDARQVALAFEGFQRFGKGRHPAGLNFGDCFAYGLARALGEPLLFKGNDFAQTDIPSAM
jgi:ribonuclease VapC